MTIGKHYSLHNIEDCCVILTLCRSLTGRLDFMVEHKCFLDCIDASARASESDGMLTLRRRLLKAPGLNRVHGTGNMLSAILACDLRHGTKGHQYL
jgi:hypothetical protein